MKHLLLIAFSLIPAKVLADPPAIEAVTVAQSGTGWAVSVTIRHPDTGWDHYADGWEVLAPDGTRLGFRELLHPHETEQPFTRSLDGLVVPEGVGQIMIRARCSVDGWNAASQAVDLGR